MNLLTLQDLVLCMPPAARRWVGCLMRPDGQVTHWQGFSSERELQEWARIVLHVGELPADNGLPFHARMEGGKLQTFRIEEGHRG